jgi:hypothetical protein
MTDLFIMWYDVYSEKRASATPILWPRIMACNACSCCWMKVVEKRRETFGWERRKEMR